MISFLQAIQNGHISSIVFHKAIQEVEKYLNLKANIRNHTKTKVRQITKEQIEKLLEKERIKEKKIFFTKKSVQGVNVIEILKPHQLTSCGFMVYKDYKVGLKHGTMFCVFLKALSASFLDASFISF